MKKRNWILALLLAAVPVFVLLTMAQPTEAVPPGGPAPEPGYCGYLAQINVVHNVTGQQGWRVTFASSLSQCWNVKIPELYQSAYYHNETPSNPVCIPKKWCDM